MHLKLTSGAPVDEHAALPWRQVECGLKRIWCFGHELAEESQDRSRISNRVVNFAGRNRTKGVEATLKACHDAKIGDGAPEGPQQIRVVLRINRQNSAVKRCKFFLVEGKLQNEDDVVHVHAKRITQLSNNGLALSSHDFH
jgi:hypothetical protein